MAREEEINWYDELRIHEDCTELFINSEDIAELKPLGIPVAGLSTLRTDYLVARRCPEEHTLLFSYKGHGRLATVEGYTDIQPGSLVLLPAKRPFIFELADNEWQTCWLLLADNDRWRSLQQPTTILRPSHLGEQVRSTLDLLHKEGYVGQHDPLILQSIISLLEHYLELALQENTHQTTAQLRLHRLFAEVDKRLHYPWTVDELAQHLHLSPPHLHRLCRQQLGCSPLRYITRLRMKRACHLLKHTDLPLQYIAAQLGYQDAFSFSHRFKKSEGISPTQWRRQAQEPEPAAKA